MLQFVLKFFLSHPLVITLNTEMIHIGHLITFEECCVSVIW